ncbi:Holliday junction DNA helicase RuvA [Bifidobacterium sp. GSD1FS]|uniref:Holliday junction branch migration complex subunit RuvA n=1 Tax=Bifidobacterium canis TaxID=2610880 RepID=A0A7K1J6J9_9BIFI|nr:Holliday junction DNA helicase RuvA [Bifidobacterium canis]
MIGMLRGHIESVDTTTALVNVHDVGFELRMPANDLATMHAGQETTIYTSMSVSQDAITLFGFLDAHSKRMFLQLQKVSGIGPKVALSLLSTLTPDDLAQAIHDGDDKALSRAPGLGKKAHRKSFSSSKDPSMWRTSRDPRLRPHGIVPLIRVSSRWWKVSCRSAGTNRMRRRLLRT